MQNGVLEEAPSGLHDLNALDGVLHSALEVAQELLTDATSAALVRAEHTLNLRLRGLMRGSQEHLELEPGGERVQRWREMK